MKTVGIIGGLGPQTTSEFYLVIIFLCQERDKNTRPAVLISSVPLPYKMEEEAITQNLGLERYIPFLTKEAQRLEKAGADFIVMPCNSLHIFIKEIRESVSIPILSIVEETINFLKKKNMQNVGIISTSITTKNKLYESAFSENSIGYSIPDENQQNRITQVIVNLVNARREEKDRGELMSIIDSFSNQKLNCVVLACTDLQLLEPTHPTIKIFDTMKIFSQATVENILK